MGNLGVSVMQILVPLVIFLPLLGSTGGVAQADDSTVWLYRAAWIWVPFLLVASLAAWFGMNDLSTTKASISQRLLVLKRLHLWVLSFLYLSTFGSFIGFSAGFAMLAKTQFPDIVILHYAFFGPLLGALARPVGGMLSDRFGGVRVTLINFILMALFSVLLYLSLATDGHAGIFAVFFGLFMLLFLTSGLGSGSTFQMIAVIFRRLTAERVKARGGSDDDALREAAGLCCSAWLYLCDWRYWRVLYPQSVRYVTRVDRFTGGGNKSVYPVLWGVHVGHLAVLWA